MLSFNSIEKMQIVVVDYDIILIGEGGDDDDDFELINRNFDFDLIVE